MSVKRAEDLPLGRATYMKVEGRPIFIVTRARVDCEICYARNEEPEAAEWTIGHQQQNVMVCKAHMQEFLDGLADMKEKGGIVEKTFGMPKV